jgi:hypothetical protein
MNHVDPSRSSSTSPPRTPRKREQLAVDTSKVFPRVHHVLETWPVRVSRRYYRTNSNLAPRTNGVRVSGGAS